VPLYCYTCPKCGRSDTKFAQMSEARTHPLCRCGTVMRRDFPAEGAGNHTAAGFRTPIEMYSIAMEDPGEIQAFKRDCPDVDVSDDPNDPLFGVPVARNRQQKLAALDAAGFEEKN